MLDVGDFEVLDECVGEDENEDEHDVRSIDGSYYDDEEEQEEHDNPKRKRESARLRETQELDENSGDNADNVLDVSIDVTENDFLESVAKDFSENIEDDIEIKTQKKKPIIRTGQPTVKVQKIDLGSNKKIEEPKVENDPPRKKPGPKSKTMNIQTPQAKKSILKINFNDSEKKNESEKNSNTSQKTNNKNEQKPENKKSVNQKPANQKPTNQKPANQKPANQKPANQDTEKQKIQSKTPNKTPAFLKKDLTDEEIMIHFDEIENTVLTSDSFVIQNEVEQAEKEQQQKEESNDKDDIKEETNQENQETAENQENQEEEENWDESETSSKRPPKIKIEEKVFKESEMWYKEKVRFFYFFHYAIYLIL